MDHRSPTDLAPTDLDQLVSQADHLALGDGPASIVADTADPIAAAWAFGTSTWAGFDRPHALRVSTLTLSIFDQLVQLRPPDLDRSPALWTRPRSRLLLHLAAILHDVGCAISYTKHHKHSYAMIASSRLSGLARQELEVVSVVARYHRRSEPKESHAMYAALSGPERELVRALASILRVGDALDRAHTQCVTSVVVSAPASGPGLSSNLLLTAHADIEPRENIDACLSKGRMLGSVFGVVLSARWNPTGPERAT